jgi:hypothetical protein
MVTKPAVLLHVEGAFLLVVSLACFHILHASWILFAALILVPDLSIAGYVAGVQPGTTLYNLVHTLTGPLALLAYALLAAHPALLPFGLIWTAHIGADRMLGFGLKYPTTFKDTHLQHV